MNFGEEYIFKELKKLDNALKMKIEVYLIGGGNMSLIRLKDATKDMDVILKKENEFAAIKNALSECGYKEKHLSIYERMGSRIVMENEDGFRWDIFVNNVCHGLTLSPSMISRSAKKFDFKNLNLFLLSKEDIFLFKGITERERDLEDMHTLFLQGLDFDVMKKEIKWQSENSDTAWIAFLFQRLKKLQEEYGIAVPDIKEIEEMAEEDAAVSLILEKMNSGHYTIEELAEELQEDKSWIEKLVKKLERAGKIKI